MVKCSHVHSEIYLLSGFREGSFPLAVIPSRLIVARFVSESSVSFNRPLTEYVLLSRFFFYLIECREHMERGYLAHARYARLFAELVQNVPLNKMRDFKKECHSRWEYNRA